VSLRATRYELDVIHLLNSLCRLQEDSGYFSTSHDIYHLDEQGNKIYDPIKRQYKCGKVQTTDWNEQTKAEEWRAAWADYVNGVLEHNGHTARIDHRSYQRQGIDQVPTIHLGAAASQMEKRGIRTERGDINRGIEVTNQKLRQLNARLVKLQTWLKEETENTEPPTLADVISNILYRKDQAGKQSHYSKIYSIKAAADMLNFLTSNKITDMAGLDKKLQGMIGQQFAIRDELKPIERRMKTIDEHLRHSGNYKAYRKHKAHYEKLYADYTTLKKATGFGAGRKSQKSLDTANEYYETYRNEITMYENAERYLRGVLQKHFDPKKLPPIAKWEAERESLTADKKRLNHEYATLKDETAKVEKIRSNVYDIMSAERHREQPHKSQDIDR